MCPKQSPAIQLHWQLNATLRILLFSLYTETPNTVLLTTAVSPWTVTSCVFRLGDMQPSHSFATIPEWMPGLWRVAIGHVTITTPVSIKWKPDICWALLPASDRVAAGHVPGSYHTCYYHLYVSRDSMASRLYGWKHPAKRSLGTPLFKIEVKVMVIWANCHPRWKSLFQRVLLILNFEPKHRHGHKNGDT